jgi:predicted nucleotidyltransferase
MRVVGVVAEYDPFHLGHAYQLHKAKERSDADYAVVVMSGCFTQRGDAAIFSSALRTRMALMNGADAVILLPCLWSVRDAEHFALGAVSLLTGLGVDALSFGAEDADLALLQQAAALLEHPSSAMNEAVQQNLKRGISHPAAVAAAAESILPEVGGLLSSPNDTLAICYLRALMRLGASADVYPIQREGSYHATDLADVLPSASAVRSALLRGEWQRATEAVPEACRPLLSDVAVSGQLHRPDALDNALLYRLRCMTFADYAALPGCTEGLDDRLRSAARKCGTKASFMEEVCTRRYPRARISRLCTHALLGVTQADVDATPLPPAALLLGIRQDAKPLLSRLGNGKIPLLGRASEYPSDRWMEIESLAWDVWGLGCGLPAGGLFTSGVVRV